MIDIHQHVLPKEYLTALESKGIMPKGGVPWPNWSPELAMEVMDRNGIDKGIFFVSEPGVYFGDKEWARYLARMVNEYAARTISDHPGKFGNFALLPLPLVDDSLKELEYAMDTLKLDGIALLTNYAGQYPGAPEFEELFAEFNRRKTIVFLHPTSAPPEQLSKLKIPGYCLEFVFDTTRAITNLIISGTLERYRDLRLICAHAGGTIPYLAQRLEYTRIRSKEWFPEIEKGAPRGMFAYLQDLYYDTGLSYGAATLSMLEKFVGYKQMMFGSDWPFAPERWLTEDVNAVANYFGGNSKIRKAVEEDNIVELLKYSRG
jgi:6-methylsalicylate decarboxylase